MYANLLRPFSRSEVASAARTTSSNSGALTLPLASSYQWILDVTAVSGTDPTLDVSIQITPDNGTTFYAVLNFKQMTTTGQDMIRVQPSQGRGEAGSEAPLSSTGGPIAQNVILTRKYQIGWVIAGSVSPSFTFVVWLFCQPKGAGTW